MMGSSFPGRYHWRCSQCRRSFDAEQVTYSCPVCPGVAVLDMVPHYRRIGAGRAPEDVIEQSDHSMWRYGPLLSVSASLGRELQSHTGWTPLLNVPALADRFGLHSLHIKDDSRNSTGSLKDRASAAVVVQAVHTGRRVVCTASSGNAAVALAASAATAGLRAVVFVPDTVPAAKLAQLNAYGADVIRVAGGYQRAVAACYRASAARDWYCRSTGYNPHTAEGKKTAGLEIAEQLGWQSPTAVLVPTGDGNIASAMHRAFLDACAMGWLDSVPRIIAVQSEAAPAIHSAWADGHASVTPSRSDSRAESINVSHPQDGFRALRAARESGGLVTLAAEADLGGATAILAATAGLFVEPASAVTVAALPHLVRDGQLGSADRVVLINTGHGLKDASLAAECARPTRQLGLATDLTALLDAVEGDW